MPKLSKLKNRPYLKDAVVDFGDGDVLTMRIDVNKFTYRLQKDMADATRLGDIDRMTDLFFQPMDSWDMTDDDGNVLPMTSQTIEDLGVNNVKDLFEAISGAINPNPGTSPS